MARGRPNSKSERLVYKLWSPAAPSKIQNGRWDQPHLMSQLADLAPLEMSTATGLHRDETGPQRLAQSHSVPTVCTKIVAHCVFVSVRGASGTDTNWIEQDQYVIGKRRTS